MLLLNLKNITYAGHGMLVTPVRRQEKPVTTYPPPRQRSHTRARHVARLHSRDAPTSIGASADAQRGERAHGARPVAP